MNGGGDPYFKAAIEELKPSWVEVEAARVAEGLTVNRGDEATGIIADELLPTSAWDERLRCAVTQSGIEPAQRGTARGGIEAGGGGTPTSEGLRCGVGKDL